MIREHSMEELTSAPGDATRLFPFEISAGYEVKVYPKSISKFEGILLFIARHGLNKFLFGIAFDLRESVLDGLQGELIEVGGNATRVLMKRCPLSRDNAVAVRHLLDFTRPTLTGLENSIGFGDRLGVANPGHLRAVEGKNLKAVLAQQSIRELQRTNRTPEEVMDAATWAVVQEGYKEGFGADADHLKTEKDIDLMVKAGYTMFTFDPSAYVVNEADTISVADLERRAAELPWEELQDTYREFLLRYDGKVFPIAGDFSLRPDRERVRRALVKYGAVLAHAARLYRHLKSQYPHHPSEVELSIDESDSPTSPFEHFLIANELKRLGIQLVSLAPRFIGDFEKGVDYKGDLEAFKREYVKHARIAEALGPYKISVHSGSDKFSVYKAIGSLREGRVHVKTAGTSYLEALRVIAAKDPELFREIMDFSRSLYTEERKTYHVSADLGDVKEAKAYSDSELPALLDRDGSRQILHVTYGRVLKAKADEERSGFKERILMCLNENEETYYEYLERHFRRHLEPLIS